MPAPRQLDPFSSLGAFFGAQLRRLRELHGWTQGETADKLGWSLATVASVEAARRNPPYGFPEKGDEVFGLPGMLTDLAELVRARPRWFEHYKELEAQAAKIAIWITNLIPGLFQTEDYARTVIRAGRPRDPEEVIEQVVAERMARQAILDRPDPPTVWAVLHEAAVKQPVGSVEITRAQLKRLLELMRYPNITVQVLPMAHAEHTGLAGPFTIFDFTDQSLVAFAEGRGSGRLIDEPGELEDISISYDRLKAAALSPEASIGLITGAMSSIWIDRT